MSTSTQARIDKGVPDAGRWTATGHSDQVTALGAPTVNDDFVASRMDEFGFASYMSPEEITQVTAELNASRDFRDENITAVADQVHLDTAGYTLTDKVAASEGLGHLARLGHEDEAAAMSRILGARRAGVSDEDADELVNVLDDLESFEIHGYDHSIANSTREKLRRVLERNDIGIITDDLGQVSRDRPLPALEADIFAVPGTNTRLHVLKPARVESADGKTTPVPANDPRLIAGQVFDKVLSPDGTVFHRLRPGVYANEPYAFRVQASRPMREDEKLQLAGLMGYAYATEVRGEGLGMPESDSPYSFVVSVDTTKSRSDDLGHAMQRFEESLPGIILEGSAPRKTDRKGPIGSRLVEGFNEQDLAIELYYDDVYEA